MLPSQLLTALALPFLAFAAPSLDRRAANPTVSIASGTIIGTATKVSNQPTVTGLVNAYLGVPFASSPPLRFAPPTEPKKWTKPLKAQTLPPACLQQFATGAEGARERAYFNNPTLAPPPESEDCLYLNVFAPQDASPTKLKPVMFWLFGGNLQFGTASLGYYNGSSLAVNEDVVVVVINYRTNIFGFSNSPQIPFGQQNSGFLDQRFALQWVQQNIKAFGGDPTKVTLFSESAGGYSIKQLLANPPSPLPFRAAIMESQQSDNTGDGPANYETVVAHFGCATAASPIDCLRVVSGTAIQSYIETAEGGLDFPPVANDGTFVMSTQASITDGEFAAVPILIGTNKDEFRVFLDMLGLDTAGGPANETAVVDEIATYASALGLPAFNATGVESELLDAYSADAGDDAFELLSR